MSSKNCLLITKLKGDNILRGICNATMMVAMILGCNNI